MIQRGDTPRHHLPHLQVRRLSSLSAGASLSSEGLRQATGSSGRRGRRATGRGGGGARWGRRLLGEVKEEDRSIVVQVFSQRYIYNFVYLAVAYVEAETL